MATSPTIDDIIRILREQPEARDAIRREILTDELLALPEQFARLTERVDSIAERLDRLTERVDAIAVRLDRLTERVDKLTEHIAEMDSKLGQLLGDRLERRAAYRLPPRLSQTLGLKRARAVYPVAVPPISESTFIDAVEEAAESGLITDEQEMRLRLTDLVFHARRKSDGARVWFAAEVSGAVGARDIDRASESAAVLRTVFGEHAEAVVMGHRIRLHDHQRAEQDGVAVVIEDDPWS